MQESIRWLFATFRHVGSALGTARAYCERGLLSHTTLAAALMMANSRGANCRTRVVSMLRNPRHAGAFVYRCSHARECSATGYFGNEGGEWP